MPLNRTVLTLATSVLFAALSACGGGSGSTDAPPPVSGGASQVQGVATPTSVSVVTAKNAH